MFEHIAIAFIDNYANNMLWVGRRKAENGYSVTAEKI